jgi:GTPase SAR1 family protein
MGEAADPLEERLAELVEHATGLADTCGLAEAAERLRAEGRRPPTPETTVVVVGEAKRGKSSLVNALVGRPGLLPVDADIASNVYVSVGFASEDRARVVLSGEADPPSPGAAPSELALQSVDIGLNDVAGYATEAANPGNRKGVRAVEIGVPHPLLERGLTVLDTPGVGGLESGHAEVTLATLPLADALLFVLDATGPITAAELGFLLRAAERIDVVVFALTKIDAHPHWQEVLGEDRALLAEHAPRFKDAPILAVSATLAAEANSERAAADPERRARLLEQAGFGALEATLEAEVLDPARELRTANLCRLLSSVAERVEEAERRRLRAAEGDGSLEAELAVGQARYEEFAASTARWRQTLTDECERLGVDVELEVRRQVEDLERRFESQLEAARPGLVERLPREVADAVEGRWLDLDACLYQGAVAIVDRLAEEFSVERVGIVADELPLPARLRRLPAPLISTEAAGGPDWQAPLVRYGPSVGAVVVARLVAPLLAPIPVIGLLALPLTAVAAGAGLLLGRVMDEQRRQEAAELRSQRDATRFVRSALAAAASEMAGELEKRLIDLRGQIEGELAGLLSRRVAELGQALDEHRAAVGAAEEVRRPLLTGARARLAEVEELRGALAVIRADLEVGLAPPGRPDAALSLISPGGEELPMSPPGDVSGDERGGGQ